MSPSQTAVVEHLETATGTAAQIADAIGMLRETVYQSLQALRDAGLVEIIGTVRNPQNIAVHVYGLIEDKPKPAGDVVTFAIAHRSDLERCWRAAA